MESLLKRWALGTALSCGLHVVGVAGFIVVVIGPYRSGGGGSGADMVEVSTAEETGDVAGVPSTEESATAESAPPQPTRRSGLARAPRASSRAGATARTASGAPGPAAKSGRSRRRLAASLPPASLNLNRPTPPSAGVGPTGDTGDSIRAAVRAELRRHLHQAWRANEVYRRIDPEGQMQGSLFTTVVELRLRADGTIERAQPVESSGVHALDQEALAATDRMQPMRKLPNEVLDAEGGWSIRCKFHLDVGMFRFAREVREVLTRTWDPSKAFASTSELERKTVVRLTLTTEGLLQDAQVTGPAGIAFLDARALEALRPGMQLPQPPRAFIRQPGPVSVFVAFLHQAGEVHVLKPREDIEEE